MWGAGCVFAECVLGKLLFCCFDGAEVDQIHKILTKFGIETPLEIREKNLNNFKEIINTSEQKPIQEKVPELNILGE